MVSVIVNTSLKKPYIITTLHDPPPIGLQWPFPLPPPISTNHASHFQTKCVDSPIQLFGLFSLISRGEDALA